MPSASPLPTSDITLGLIAGGRALRLGGVDKAWLRRDGVPQVVRWRDRFAGEVGAVLVSSNHPDPRYAAHGFAVVADADGTAGQGPLAGLLALATACTTPWLFTVPVDLVQCNDCLLRTLVALRGDDGALAQDDDGLQPLVALWQRDALRTAAADALARGERAVHRLAEHRTVPVVSFPGVRFGNLNTQDDLRAAGVETEPVAP
jgi:molybdopterin-guanine dinucleotide biosynthesis protein A